MRRLVYYAAVFEETQLGGKNLHWFSVLLKAYIWAIKKKEVFRIVS